MSIIGKQYKPIDNSWSCNLSQTLHECYKKEPLIIDYLAGVGNQDGKICTILTEPFILNIFGMGSGGISHRQHEFIIIDHRGEQHIQLFYPHAIIENIVNN